MPSDKPKIIRIVKKKGGHGGHHGGSWKVAYADFVTAMMAFFLLMWLVNMTKPDQKEAIAKYFTEFSLFDRAGYQTGHGKAEQIAGQAPKVPPPPRMGHEIKGASAAEVQAREELRAVLARGVQASLGALAGQVIVENFEDGVRIHLVDSNGTPFFEQNSPGPTEAGRKALDVVAENLKNLPQRIAIEGHTDGRGSLSGARSNWDLSSERAQLARRALEAHGVSPARLVRVSGYASATPLISTDIMDPRNRRVSILVYDAGTALPVSTYGIATEAARQSGGASGKPGIPVPAYEEGLSLKPEPRK